MLSDSQGKTARLSDVTVVCLQEAFLLLKKMSNLERTINIGHTGLLALMRMVMKRNLTILIPQRENFL
jgi:hypothetical protein